MLLDLSLVTQSLQTLLRTNIPVIWPPLAGIAVSPLPPDLFKDEGLAIYLFHLGEDPYFKNTPPLSRDVPPVAFAPMGVDLYFLLTAHSKAPGDQAALNEQTMMGLGVKTLHDFSILDDQTQAGNPNNPVTVFPASLRGSGNRFRLSIEPVTFSDAPHYWTAGQQPLRLAAYYHVSVIMLEPERTTEFAGRVLRYGVFAFDRSGPRLEASTNTVSFISPDDGAIHSIQAQPAEVPIGSSVSFIGSGLTGDATTLTVNYPSWGAPIQADAAWAVAVSDDQITATVQATIGAPPQTMVPGIYSAHATVAVTRRLPDSTYKQFLNVSNDTPFSIAPKVTNSPVPDGTGTATITGSTFADPSLINPDNVVIVFGMDRFARAATLAALERSEFFIQDAATIIFKIPVGLNSGTFVPLRVIVNGVESWPQWVKIP
ncbi:MAG TPA: DUF4255 domain-containing protein [Candidatus Binatia bacterium]|nr:DUF4255 domain-containing protein [Candidatus Binatia bacterium]